MNILVFGRDWAELLVRVKLVLKALEKAGLTLNLKKCQLGLDKVDILGYRISAKGIEPGESKVQAIEKFETPQDIHAVRRFLGLTSFFRRFVPGFSKIAAPLSKLIRKDESFLWSKDQKKAFYELKQCLKTQPILCVYDPQAKFTELHTDYWESSIRSFIRISTAF